MKGKSYASSLDAALASLDSKLAAFKDEVTICNSQRLGEMEQSQLRIEQGQSQIMNCEYIRNGICRLLSTWLITVSQFSSRP